MDFYEQQLLLINKDIQETLDFLTPFRQRPTCIQKEKDICLAIEKNNKEMVNSKSQKLERDRFAYTMNIAYKWGLANNTNRQGKFRRNYKTNDE